MKLPVFSMVAAMLVAMPAMALDLHQARAQGKVGEQADGYVAVLQPDAEVSALVSEVNAKRRAHYARISQQNGQPVDVAAKLAVPEIVRELAPGNLYQDGSGSWKKR